MFCFACRFGDIRSQMCQFIVQLWHRLGTKKGNFIPNMIGPFLRISLLMEKGTATHSCCVPQLYTNLPRSFNLTEIQRVAIPLVYDFMKYEQQTNGNFKRVQ